MSEGDRSHNRDVQATEDQIMYISGKLTLRSVRRANTTAYEKILHIGDVPLVSENLKGLMGKNVILEERIDLGGEIVDLPSFAEGR